MQRYLNTFYRYIWLMIIPLLLIPVGIGLSATKSYTAGGSLWVEKPLYTDQQHSDGGSAWQTPAAQVAGLLTELMTTRSFVNSIIKEAPSVQEALKNVNDDNVRQDFIVKNFKVDASNVRLITVSYKGTRPDVTLEGLQAVVKLFKAYYDDRITQQGQSAIAFYQTRLNEAKMAVDKADKEVNDFLAAHPNKVGADETTRALTPEDLQFQLLLQNRTAARKQYDDYNSSIEKVRNSYNAYLEGQDITLKIQDAPLLYSDSAGGLRQLAIGVGIGLVGGGILVVLLVVLLTYFDKSFRLADDTIESLKIGRVLEIPNVKPLPGWSKWRAAKLAALAAVAPSEKLLTSGNLSLAVSSQEAEAVVVKERPQYKPSFSFRDSLGEQISPPPGRNHPNINY